LLGTLKAKVYVNHLHIWKEFQENIRHEISIIPVMQL
jgi:hypothetical protein